MLWDTRRRYGPPVLLLPDGVILLRYACGRCGIRYYLESAFLCPALPKKETTTCAVCLGRASNPHLRNRVYLKTGGYCFYCHKELPLNWEVEHVFPKSRGGASDIQNYLPACKACNRTKGKRLPNTLFGKSI